MSGVAPRIMEVGNIYQIVPDGDDYDNQLARVTAVSEYDGCCDIVVLTGIRKGDEHKEWPFGNFVTVNPLILLAEQAK